VLAIRLLGVNTVEVENADEVDGRRSDMPRPDVKQKQQQLGESTKT
jgi:hypothetical protein